MEALLPRVRNKPSTSRPHISPETDVSWNSVAVLTKLQKIRNLVLVSLQNLLPMLAGTSASAEFQRDIISAGIQLSIGLYITFGLRASPIPIRRPDCFNCDRWLSLDSIVRI